MATLRFELGIESFEHRNRVRRPQGSDESRSAAGEAAPRRRSSRRARSARCTSLSSTASESGREPASTSARCSGASTGGGRGGKLTPIQTPYMPGERAWPAGIRGGAPFLGPALRIVIVVFWRSRRRFGRGARRFRRGLGCLLLAAGADPPDELRGRFDAPSRFMPRGPRRASFLLLLLFSFSFSLGSFTAMASPLVTSKLGGVLGSQPGPKLSALKR